MSADQERSTFLPFPLRRRQLSFQCACYTLPHGNRMQNKDTLHSAAKLYGRVCIIGAISAWIGLKNGAVSCPTHTKSLKKSLYIWHCWWVQSCPTVNLCIYKMQRIALWLCWHASLAKCSDRRFLFETTDHLSDCNTSYTVSTCTIFVHKAPAIYPQTPPSDAASLETFKTQIEMSPHCHLTGLFTVSSTSLAIS